MPDDRPDPIRPTDEAARQMARDLLAAAQTAALAVIGPDGAPVVTRVSFGRAPGGAPISLVSGIAAHTRALQADPRASLLIGEAGARGDPLTHPRLTLQARARFTAQGEPGHAGLAEAWLREHPKARLYIGFADFRFACFDVQSAFLNGGFGQAFRLTPQDLGL